MTDKRRKMTMMGTDNTLHMDSVGENKSQEVKEPSRKRRDLSNRPDGYKTIGVAREIKSIMSDGYNAYVFIGDELKSTQFKDTVHQVCMPHAKIFAYLDDVELQIDNNLAEQTIRKLSTQRNNSLHYGSDAGTERAPLIIV